jgi:hypothetical protein
MQIRRFTDADWPALSPLLQATFASGDTYAFAPDSSEAEIGRAWVRATACRSPPTTRQPLVVASFEALPHGAEPAHFVRCSS